MTNVFSDRAVGRRALNYTTFSCNRSHGTIPRNGRPSGRVVSATLVGSKALELQPAALARSGAANCNCDNTGTDSLNRSRNLSGTGDNDRSQALQRARSRP
ncbi:hypothetical protein EVAR_38881_1 [Eumeta japonica]|uniref:Uncharacterized protein n=1 Tax=Eumeta variegata TaxID=151549 RepID=A0A4C1X6Y0_EUMVA|nr:hypothetical protein EVAR_38881_1 [Eumeta japonica]